MIDLLFNVCFSLFVIGTLGFALTGTFWFVYRIIYDTSKKCDQKKKK